MIEGQTEIQRGSAVTGRVLAAKDSGRHSRGYLRLALVSLNVEGKPMAIQTASLFIKAGPHGKRDRTSTSTVPKSAFAPETTEKKEVLFEVEHRLTFRLAQSLEFR